MKYRRSLFFTISLVIFISLAGTVIAKDYVKMIDGNKAVKGQLAPRFKIATLDGETYNLTDFRSKKSIVFTFWATWCEPCKKELVYLQQFHDKYSDSCEVIAISIDSEKHKKVVKNNVKKLDLSIPIGLDPDNRIREKIYESSMIPFLVVIDKEGKVLLMKEGAPHPEKVIEELEELLGKNITPNKEQAEAEDTEKAGETQE